MDYWGHYLPQSDHDLDIVCEVSERVGVELKCFESDEEEIKAREALNDGKFDEFFNAIRAEKRKKTLILLTAVAMQLVPTSKIINANSLSKSTRKLL